MIETTFLGKTDIAEGTVQFRFEKPDGFSYEAGQSIDLYLQDSPQGEGGGTMHAYTLSSAPHEDYIAITTRMRDSAFKRVLGSLKEGSTVLIDGPFGSFMLHENISRPAVMLAGGIGVTPFHSMVSEATHKKLPHTVILFYSNRRPEDAAYLEELLKLEEENPHFKLVATMTDMEKSSKEWSGERGYIDAVMLEKFVSKDANPIFYLAGPQAMVSAMRTLLNTWGVSNDDIRFEEFSGY